MKALFASSVGELFSEWLPSSASDDADVVLWEPLPATEGRGLLQADGRVLSPQQMAFETLADELFFGGSGGGGKSDLIIGLAVTEHKRSIIFRRELKQVTGAQGLWERAKEIVGDYGRPNESRYIIKGIPGGRVLELGGVEREEDKNKYKGKPHDLKAFDEIPEFTEAQYRFLIAWLRSSVIGQRVRVVATGNPPTTPEGEWINRYWAPWLDKRHPNPAQPGELRWFVTVNGEDVELLTGAAVWLIIARGGDRVDTGDSGCTHDLHVATSRCRHCKALHVVPRSRTFIPASVEDNPHYMATGYDQVLNSLPEPLRSQMRFGDFAATQHDNAWQVIPTAWIQAAQDRYETHRPGKDDSLSAVGVDPARGGPDKFAIALRFGGWVTLVVHKGEEAKDGKAGAALIDKAIQHDTTVQIGIDVIGTAGPSCFDAVQDLDLYAIGLNGSEKSQARDKTMRLKFANKRAEWHWNMRELLSPEAEFPIALPPDPELRADLAAPRWQPSPQGVRIEKKEEIKKRIGRSPDKGEAVIYAFASQSGDGLGFLAFAQGEMTADKKRIADEQKTREQQQQAEEDENPFITAHKDESDTDDTNEGE